MPDRGASGVLARLAADRRGASAVMFAFALPVLLGFLGLGVEVAYWYLEKRELHEATDSGALAGVYEYVNNSADQTGMEAAATAAAAKSGFTAVDFTTKDVLNQPPASGPFAIGGPLEDPTAVEVILTETYNTLFVSVLGIDTLDIRTRAVAVEGGGGEGYEGCLLALAEDQTEICKNNKTGIVFQGSLDLQMPSCGIHSNDSCGPSMNFNGNPTVNAGCLTYSGGLDADQEPISGDNTNLTLAACNEPEYLKVQSNPYDGIYIPETMELQSYAVASPGGVESDDPAQQDYIDPATGETVITHRIFSPGYYPDDDPDPNSGGIELLGDTGQVNILMPGTYFIEGSIFINGGSIIAADGVTLALIDTDGTFDFRGNGDLILEAPSADDIYNSVYTAGYDPIKDQGVAAVPMHSWDGIALYLADNTNLGDNNPCANKINGTSTMQVSGTVYAPDTCLTFTGNNTSGDPTDACFRMVAGNVTLAGNVTMSTENCYIADNTKIKSGTMVGLVE